MSANTRDDHEDDFETTREHIDDPEERRKRLAELEQKILDDMNLSDAEMREYVRERLYGINKIVFECSDLSKNDLGGIYWLFQKELKDAYFEEKHE